MALCSPAGALRPLPKLHDRRRTSGLCPRQSKPNPRGRNGCVVRMSQLSGGHVAAKPEEGRLEMPRWAKETPLSRLVGALVSFKPLYSLMKLGARQVLIREILESDVHKELESIQEPSLVYPDYYLNPFHVYDEGNLSWLAAADAEASTLFIVKKAVPDAPSIDEANKIFHGNWLNAIEEHRLKYSGNFQVNDILDIGCSVGVSTRYIAEKYPLAKVIGLDLSPYFLAVAQYKEEKKAVRSDQIRWIHANGEATGLPSRSFDLVSLAFVLHECPAQAIVGIVKESFRLLRPGGTIAMTDIAPKSKVLQELSPVLFTLMKSTEPFLDEYSLLDLEETMRTVGFANVTSVLIDPMIRTVTGTVPH